MHSQFDEHSDAGAVTLMTTRGVDGADLALALLEQSMDCVKILSIDGHIDFMNCAGLEVMEIDNASTVIGKFWWDLWPEPLQSLVQGKFNESLEGREICFEADCPTAKGSPRTWSVSLRPLLAANGPAVSVLSTSRDITRSVRTDQTGPVAT